MIVPWQMSIGTRILRHGQSTVRVSLSTASREPLLFLYPAWARSASTVVAQPSSTPSLPPDARSIPSTRDTGISSSSESFGNGLGLKTIECKEDGRIEGVVHGTLYPEKEQTIEAGQKRPTWRANPEFPLAEEKNDADIQRRGLFAKGNSEVRVRRVLAKNEKTAKQRVRNAESRRLWQSERDERKHRAEADWRLTLQKLIQHTPQRDEWLVDPITVEVSEESGSRLVNGLDEDIRTIVEAHDCTVRFGNSIKGGKVGQTFILSGSAISISKATAQILRVAPEAEIKATSSVDRLSSTVSSDAWTKAQASRPLVRYAYSSGSKWKNIGSTLVEPPTEWNSHTFLEYVRQLTTTQPSGRSSAHHKTRPKDQVLQRLRELFGQDKYMPYVTGMALRTIFAYHMRMRSISDARAIFNTHVVQDPEIFNIMLRGPAKQNDISNFDYILDLMINRGLTPNSRTWLAFLQANSDNFDIQMSILSAMIANGLMQDPPTIKAVCAILVPQEVDLGLFTLDSSEHFLQACQHMENKYGEHWFSLGAANRILNVLGSKGLIPQCYRFLDFMKTQSIKPDTFSVNTILHHCKQPRNLDRAGEGVELALKVLRLVSTDASFIPNAETFRILFEMAWQSRNYNMVRIIWKYACLSQDVGFRMRTRVKESLRRRSDESSLSSPRSRFNTLAGRFIIAHSTKELPFRQNLESFNLAGESAGTSELDFSLSQVTELILKETESMPATFPQRDFIDMMEEAFRVDLRWKQAESEARQKKSLEWMIENGVRIPFA